MRACPSGALRYSRVGGEPRHLVPDHAGVTVEKDGPYRVVGVPLASARLAEGASPTKYVLYRCGASKNKPYCDVSHYEVGWSDASA